MSERGTFPFGSSSTDRPARTAEAGAAELFVLGVYPSALHIRWGLPRWATHQLGMTSSHVEAIAVDVEPTVFWNGLDRQERVENWKERVGWVEGDEQGCWGYADTATLNGKSGRDVEEDVLNPLQVKPERTWFTDAIPYFFIKEPTARSREQGGVIESVYNPVASALGLAPATLPIRPSDPALIDQAIEEHADRLRSEFARSGTEDVVTLGEPARQVLIGIADRAEGPPIGKLRADNDFGQEGRIVIEGRSARWRALTHPGNRAASWREARKKWKSAVGRR